MVISIYSKICIGNFIVYFHQFIVKKVLMFKFLDVFFDFLNIEHEDQIFKLNKVIHFFVSCELQFYSDFF